MAKIIALAVLALGGGIFAQQYFATKPAAIDFTLPDLAGKQRNLQHWQGKIRIVNFWASWCPSCRQEIPQFIKLQNELASQVQFIGIACENRLDATNYTNTVAINYPILIAGEGGINLSQQLGNTSATLPFTILINQTGQIISHHQGIITPQQIHNLVYPLLSG